jgi:hypothetical protein
LKPNDIYIGRTAPLTSRRCILYIYSTNIGTEHFKPASHSPFSSLQNAVYFIMLPLTPNDIYIGRTAPLTSIRCILYIYSTNIGTEYFKHAAHSPFSPLQIAVCFIMLPLLVLVLLTLYIQGVLKLKKNSGAKGLNTVTVIRNKHIAN